MGCGPSKAGDQGPDEIIAMIENSRKKNPDNLMAKHFDKAYYDSLSDDLKARLLKCCLSGAYNVDSGLGCYAMQPKDYDDLKPFFQKVILEYHKIADASKVHVNDWSLAGAEGLPESGVLDLKELGLDEISMRVRVGRNLADFPLPGAMTEQDRIDLEKRMIGAFEVLMADPAYGGTYNSLTPGGKYSIDSKKYKELVAAHIMFKDMAADAYLKTAGIASHWPSGRGCYVSEDKGFIVWVGEEDHLRIMCMKKGSVLNEVFDRLQIAADKVESLGMKFAKSSSYGYVTSCPSNLGTGMRASVHVKIPALTSDGTDTKAKAVAKPLGLSVRGTGGEHTPIGKDGTVDISPSARLMIAEKDIVCALYKGIKLLLEEEAKAGGSAPAAAAPAAEAPAEEAAAPAEEAPAEEAAAPAEEPAAE
jgi:creatine kinase